MSAPAPTSVVTLEESQGHHRRRRRHSFRKPHWRRHWVRLTVLAMLALLAAWTLVRILELDGKPRQRATPVTQIGS